MQPTQRRPYTKLLLLFTAGIVSILITLLYNYDASDASSMHKQNAHIPKSHTMPKTLDRFTGQWYVHSGVLTVKDDGNATFIARAYRDCAPDVKSPCDTWKGDLIIPGIREDIVITDIREQTAYGTITNSTDNRTGQHITMILQAQDTLLFGDRILCGPQAPAGYCGA